MSKKNYSPQIDTENTFSVNSGVDSKLKASRSVAPNARSHAPEPATTLRRDSIKKPDLSKSSKKLRSTSLIKQPKVNVPAKLSVASINQDRIRRAKTVAKSKLVSRFSSHPLSPNPIVYISSDESKATVSAPSLATTPKSDFLLNAISKANSHNQPKYKKSYSKAVKRAAGIGAVAFGVLLLVGIVGYQNISNLKIDSASSKAGFAASLPAYKPAGFSLESVGAGPGKVAANFASNSDQSRNYTLTEKPSNWDSNSLRDLFVTKTDAQYQTSAISGRTIFLYGQNSATWVANGIWYVIDGNGSLSYQQLLSLASSL